MKVLLILQLLIPLFFFTSCNDTANERLRKKSLYFEATNIGFYQYDVKLDDIESKIFKRIIYLFPTFNGKPTDIHMRIEIDKESSCGLYFYQGNPMKIDYHFPMLTNEKRLKVKRTDTELHKTTYQEQIEVLRYLTSQCKKMGIDNFGCVIWNFDDLGELCVDITELCDSVKKAMPNKDKGIFPIAMEKTKLAKDLKSIFDNYDVKFMDYLWYHKNIIPYNQYAIKHQLKNKHNTPHVYPIHHVHVILQKK